MKCPLCKNKDDFEYIEAIYSEEMKIEYKIFKCKKCKLEFSHPMKSAPPFHYEKQEWYGYRWEFYETLKSLGNKKVKILEIGCGKGYFLNLANKKGHEVTGIDFNKKAIKEAERQFNLEKVFPLTLEEFLKNFPEEKFDVICFFHVIEHLENPVNFITRIKNILNKEGFLIFSLPNDKRFSLFKKREEWDYPPHHLTRWNEKSIKFLINITQLNLLDMKNEPPYNEILNKLMIKIHFGLSKRFKKIQNNLKIPNCKKPLPTFTKLVKIKKFFFSPFAFLYSFILKLKRISGTSKLVICQRKDESDYK